MSKKQNKTEAGNTPRQDHETPAAFTATPAFAPLGGEQQGMAVDVGMTPHQQAVMATMQAPVTVNPPEPVLCIGRIVHFVRPGYAPVPAIVTRVHNPVCVNLTVFLDLADSTFAAEVPKGTPDEPHESGRFWYWPPRF